MSAYGSAVIAKSSDVSLQAAYNAGNTIQTSPGLPVAITSDNPNGGTAGIDLRGSMVINGGSSQLGGIYNEAGSGPLSNGDQSFQIGNESNKPASVWAGLDAVKTHQGFTGSGTERCTAAQTCTGSAGSIIVGVANALYGTSGITLQTNYAYRIKINATARRSDGPLGVSSFTMEGTFYNLAGVAYAAGQPQSQVNGFDGDGGNYAIVFALSGADVMAVVYGTTSSTIQWVLTVEVQAVSTST
jgi:hypothetical protein